MTVPPEEVIDVIKGHGRLRVLDEQDLVVEVETMEDYEKLSQALQDTFGGEVNLDLIPKKG